MSDLSDYKIIELIVLFGAVAGFCFWQMRMMSRLQREREQAEAEDRPSRED